jgi:hypothetical protein
MSKLRNRLITEFGEDENERFDAIHTLIQETSPEKTWVMWLMVYNRIMRGDSIPDITHDCMYSSTRVPRYFDRLIEKNRLKKSRR